jgi:hypothetical protein
MVSGHVPTGFKPTASLRSNTILCAPTHQNNPPHTHTAHHTLSIPTVPDKLTVVLAPILLFVHTPTMQCTRFKPTTILHTIGTGEDPVPVLLIN